MIIFLYVQNLSMNSQDLLCNFKFLNLSYKIPHQLASETISETVCYCFISVKVCILFDSKLVIFKKCSSWIILVRAYLHLTNSPSSLNLYIFLKGWFFWFLKPFPKCFLKQTVLSSLKHFLCYLLFVYVSVYIIIRILIGWYLPHLGFLGTNSSK